MGILIVNSDFERIWNEPYPTISFDNATYSLAGEVGTTLSASFAIFDNYDADVTDQCEITLDNDNVSIEDGMFVCDDLEVGTYQTIATATYSYKSATVTATATINISVEEEQPTSISFDSNSYTITGTEGDTITQSFTVTDDLSNNVTSQCSYTLSPNDTGLTASNGTFDASSVTAGTYSVTVTATYASGNGSTLTATATISIEVQSASFANKYLTFEALESGTFSQVSNITVDYSVDGGTTWTTLSANTASPTVNAGERIIWKAEKGTNWLYFTSTGRFNAYGNTMSLIYGDNFENKTTFPTGQNLSNLFKNSNIVNAKNLILPATTLTAYCYHSMFSGCTGLTTAPELPATTLGSECYRGMFYGCTSLTTAPELPATTLAYACYGGMFNGCTSLTTAPELPATTLTSWCYAGLSGSDNKGMFSGCTSLTVAPELPATTLSEGCYYYMFSGCTSLTTAPVLNATTLTSSCYQYMFQGCTSLTTAPELPATTLGSECYMGMFQGCTSLTTAPELPATTLTNGCYQWMFGYCTSLNNIKMLATDISANRCLSTWVQGVAATGTFTKAASMTTLPTGASGIPSGWTVVDAS